MPATQLVLGHTKPSVRKRKVSKSLVNKVNKLERKLNLNTKNCARCTSFSSGDWQPSEIYDFLCGGNIGDGDEWGQRRGNQVDYKGLEFSFVLTNVSDTTNYYMRLLFVRDKQPGLPLAESFWEPDNNFLYQPINLMTSTLNTLIYKPNKERYTVISDRLYTLESKNVSAGKDFQLIKKMYFKVNRKLTWTNALTAYDAIMPSYRLVAIICNDAGSASFPTGNIRMTRKYKEIFSE